MVVGLNRSYFRGYKQLWNPTGDPFHGVERHPGCGCSVGSVTKFSTSPLKDNPERLATSLNGFKGIQQRRGQRGLDTSVAATAAAVVLVETGGVCEV